MKITKIEIMKIYNYYIDMLAFNAGNICASFTSEQEAERMRFISRHICSITETIHLADNKNNVII